MLTLSAVSCWAVPSDTAPTNIAPNSVGVTGLLHIPTAEMPPVGTLLLSGGNIPRRMVPGDFRTERLHHYAVGVTLLPGLETTLNFTLLRLHGARHYNNQDRNGSVRLRLLKERGRWMPQVVVGATSLLCEGGSSWWENYYLVATRHFHSERHGTFGLTAGYYFPHGLYARYYDRPFGGVSWTPLLLPAPFEHLAQLTLMSEYDSHQWNYALRVTLLRRLSYTLGLTDGREWTWQLGWQFRL